jgi:hypothetical protein
MRFWRQAGISPASHREGAVVTALVVSLMLAGCSTTDKEYSGPALPDSAVAVVEVGQTAVFDRSVPLGIVSIDGTDHGGPESADLLVPFANQEYRLLPGPHAFVMIGPASKDIIMGFHHDQQFSVTATLEAGKRYRFVGRRDPLSVKGVLVGVLSGDVPVHVELVNETDGGTVHYSRELELGPRPLLGTQMMAASPLDGPMSPGPVPPEPPAAPAVGGMSYSRWASQQSDGN